MQQSLSLSLKTLTLIGALACAFDGGVATAAPTDGASEKTPMSDFSMQDAIDKNKGGLTNDGRDFAKARIEPRSGSTVKGKVEFQETGDGVKVKYKLEGLNPKEMHGFHIHETGDCTTADAKSAGPHYAEIAKGGGTSQDFPHRYAGDLPQVSSDAKGKAEGSFLMPTFTIDEKFGISDRAIIVHGGPDDISKKSAPRVGCGVIKKTS